MRRYLQEARGPPPPPPLEKVKCIKERTKEKERKKRVRSILLAHSNSVGETGSIFNCSLRLDLLVIFINTQLAGGKMGRAAGDVNTD